MRVGDRPVYADPVTHSARIVVDPTLGGVDAALRRLRATIEMREIRKRTRFVGPSEQRREKHRRYLQRLRRKRR